MKRKEQKADVAGKLTDPARKMKVVLVGDLCVGKTSLANVFVSNHFQENYTSTVGANVTAKTLDNPNVTLQIWDTAGMERFRSLLPHYMRNAECAICVYDMSSRDTFSSIADYWIDYVKAASSEALTKVLVANKCDTLTKEGRQLAETNNMLFFETSAKHSINVDKMFIEAATAVLKTTPKPEVQSNSGVCLESVGERKLKCCLSS
ncbi:unnamed protein product [Candidula unifasciata]|uniref:Uncharacterized protein n=1 Tax=Candidula unifasciata TaxID=100452 RepID=A0A8S3ZMK5_9EUPU|nr:unnamed protein product [Candidula unifasciata]